MLNIFNTSSLPIMSIYKMSIVSHSFFSGIQSVGSMWLRASEGVNVAFVCSCMPILGKSDK